MNRKLFSAYLFALISSALILSCATIQIGTPTSTPTPYYASWIVRWLNNPACKSPCWEGITAGMTQTGDVSKLLQPVPEITNLQGPMPSPITGDKKISWQWDFKASQSSGDIDTDDQGLIVEKIWLFTSDLNLPLRDVISSKGFPDYVLITRLNDPKNYYVDLIYASSNMGMLLYFPTGSGSVTLSPDERVEIITLFSSNYYSVAYSQYFGIMQKWNGYGVYKFQ